MEPVWSRVRGHGCDAHWLARGVPPGLNTRTRPVDRKTDTLKPAVTNRYLDNEFQRARTRLLEEEKPYTRRRSRE